MHMGRISAEGVAFEPRLGAPLPVRLAFTDEAGRAFSLGQVLDGKPAVLVLGYLACKDLCPTTLAGVTQALDASGLAPGRDYRALFVSIDPRESAADLLREKDARIAAASRGAWAFLRGDAARGRAARERRGLPLPVRARSRRVRPSGRLHRGHARRCRLARFSRACDSIPRRSRRRFAKRGRAIVGPPASPLLLLCYHFDPATGRYTLRILDILNVAIAVFLAAAALWAWRLRARRRRP